MCHRCHEGVIAFAIQIAPNVGTEQINPGDVFLVHYHTPAGDVIQATTLTMYFLTVPAVASYDSGAGVQSVSYPVAQSAPGTSGNPIMMSSGSLTLNIWRPQRAALPGEAGPFIDVGHLHYGIPLTTQNGSHEAGCASQFYSRLSPSLQVLQGAQDGIYNTLFPLHDTAEDAPAPFEGDPLARRETLELVRAYYRITDPAVRRRLFELVKSLGASESF